MSKDKEMIEKMKVLMVTAMPFQMKKDSSYENQKCNHEDAISGSFNEHGNFVYECDLCGEYFGERKKV